MTALTQSEALARQIILDRTSRRRHERPVQRHVRSALILRRLAERLDPPAPSETPARVIRDRRRMAVQPAAARH